MRSMWLRVILISVASLTLACGSTQKKEGQPVAVQLPESAVEKGLKAASAEEFGKRCLDGLGQANQLLTVLLGDRSGASTATPEELLEQLNEISRQVEQSASLAGLIQSVHPDESFRNEAKACEQQVEKFLAELGLNRKLYLLYSELNDRGLSREAKRFREHTLRDFRRAGVDKSAEVRAELKKIDEQLVVLGQKFAENIVKDVREVLVTKEDLAGLPADFVASHEPSKNEKIRITTNYPDYQPVMAYADSAKLRRELYIAAKSRGGMDNELVLREILALRQRKASLLGHANWADYVTEDKMMRSGDRAAQFIDRVSKIAKPRAARDYAELLARKRKDVPDAAGVADWEKTYYENKVKADSYAFDIQSVRPYFEYSAVEAGLLDITAEMYGLEYVSVPDSPTWHADVRVFDVRRGGITIGRIYLDMHPRDGKYQHAAQFTLQSGVAGEQLPMGVLVCNFPQPAAGAPALMEHAQVTTMFHEFGHLMHHVLGGEQRWISQSGVATEWDFVEAPSQMFEEWAWQPETLQRFARHHERNEKIPAELVERMRRADRFALGTRTLQQMFYASMSLEFHRRDPASLELMDTMIELQNRITPFPYVEGTRFYSSFNHLNGYSAMYYTYEWSLVIAKDLLTPFKEHGLMNEEWTARYRDRVLAPGGTKDAAELVQDFLGRPFSFDAYESYLRN